MPLFQIGEQDKLRSIGLTNFTVEKDLQRLIENSLDTVFNCRFIASEFTTGIQHAGRIDTLAVSEDDNPVIIEYKKVESSELINQSLYYLSWIRDHRGDFQIEANRALGEGTIVDWDDVRVICIAPGYKKYDLHAVQMMGANIELWQYRLFDNGAFYLEEVFRRAVSAVATMPDTDHSTPETLSAGKKAALTRLTGVYSVDEHLLNLSDPVKQLVSDLRDYIVQLDSAVEEVPKKMYIAYKLAQNFACMAPQKSKIKLWLKLDPTDVGDLPSNATDVRNVGHHGTGNLELNIQDKAELESAKRLIRLAFERVGG